MQVERVRAVEAMDMAAARVASAQQTSPISELTTSNNPTPSAASLVWINVCIRIPYTV